MQFECSHEYGRQYLVQLSSSTGCSGKLTVDTWGFSSCAVVTIYNFKWLPSELLNTKAEAQKLFSFVLEFVCPTDGYNPKEVYFFLSKSQMKQYEKSLLALEHVKKIDQFTNKAHDGNHVALFRYSVEKDFKGVL